MSTTMNPAARTEQPSSAELLGAIRWNAYRLAITTRPKITDPRTPGASMVTAAPLLTQLRDAVRPNQGRTDSGRGGGAGSLPYDLAASTLLGDIEGGIQGMYRSALKREPIGSAEQLLLEWLREFEYSFREGEVIDAQLRNLLDRIRGWRFQIEDHFTPPRQREFAFCPRCGYTDHLVLVDGNVIQQRCVVVTWWPSNERRPPIAECRREACDGRWVGWDALKQLGAEVTDNEAHYGPLETGLIAPLPEPTPDALAEAPTQQENP